MQHVLRRTGIAFQFFCYRRTGGGIDNVDEPQRQLGIVAFFLRRMRRFLDIEVGEDAKQDWSRIDTGPVRQSGKTGQTIKFFETQEFHGTTQTHNGDLIREPVSGPLTWRLS